MNESLDPINIDGVTRGKSSGPGREMDRYTTRRLGLVAFYGDPTRRYPPIDAFIPGGTPPNVAARVPQVL